MRMGFFLECALMVCAVLVVPGCDGGDDCPVGTASCACTEAGDCDGPLTCASDRCVSLPGDGDGDGDEDAPSKGERLGGGSQDAGMNVVAGDGDGDGDGDAVGDGDGDGDAVGDGDGDATPVPQPLTPNVGMMQSPEGGMEGAPCEVEVDCEPGLTCVANIFTIGICARACTENGECDAETFESCVSYTEFAADAHCVDPIDDAYGICGVADTSLCSGRRECLYFPDLPLGVCVDLCSVSGAAGLPDTVVECQASQTCLNILAGGDDIGVCGTVVSRGEECGLDVGLFCPDGDMCRRQDASNFAEPPICYQDCTAGEICDTGECTRLDAETRVCL